MSGRAIGQTLRQRIRIRTVTGAPDGGFTLVELMVALTLAAIISMTIMVISNTAREIYQGTTKKVELSNKFRIALLNIDRDFRQWVNTANMEYFADGRGVGTRINFQWDEGEQLPDTRDALGPGVLDGGVFGEYDEFASITELHYLGVAPGLDPSNPSNRKIHDAYQAYFRTMAYVDGQVREANVEYKLLDPNRPGPNGNPQPPREVVGERMADLVLVKVVRYHSIHWDQLFKVAQNFPIMRRRIEVASNITDFKIEYFTENPFNPSREGGFKTPEQDFERPVETATRPTELQSPQVEPSYRQFRKVFGYGTNKVQQQFARGTAFKARQGDREQKGQHEPVRFGFLSSSEVQFAELTQGDQIYVFTEGDRGSGQVAGANRPSGQQLQFPSRLYTVRANVSGLLEFYESIDSSTWQSDQPSLLYKASFLPSAVRVTMRLVDDQGRNPKTLQREIWIRRKAR